MLFRQNRDFILSKHVTDTDMNLCIAQLKGAIARLNKMLANKENYYVFAEDELIRAKIDDAEKRDEVPEEEDIQNLYYRVDYNFNIVKYRKDTLSLCKNYFLLAMRYDDEAKYDLAFDACQSAMSELKLIGHVVTDYALSNFCQRIEKLAVFDAMVVDAPSAIKEDEEEAEHHPQKRRQN